MKRGLFIGFFVLISLGLFYTAPLSEGNSISGESIISPSIPSPIFGCLQYGYFKQQPPTTQPAQGGTADCNDRRDNDGDNKIDFPDDPQCYDLADYSEAKDGRQDQNGRTDPRTLPPTTQPATTQPTTTQPVISAASFRAKCFDSGLEGFAPDSNTKATINGVYEGKETIGWKANGQGEVSITGLNSDGARFDKPLTTSRVDGNSVCDVYSFSYSRDSKTLDYELPLKEKVASGGREYCVYDALGIEEDLSLLGGTPLNQEQVATSCPLLLGNVELESGQDCANPQTCELDISSGASEDYLLGVSKDGCGNSAVKIISDVDGFLTSDFCVIEEGSVKGATARNIVSPWRQPIGVPVLATGGHQSSSSESTSNNQPLFASCVNSEKPECVTDSDCPEACQKCESGMCWTPAGYQGKSCGDTCCTSDEACRGNECVSKCKLVEEEDEFNRKFKACNSYDLTDGKEMGWTCCPEGEICGYWLRPDSPYGPEYNCFYVAPGENREDVIQSLRGDFPGGVFY